MTPLFIFLVLLTSQVLGGLNNGASSKNVGGRRQPTGGGGLDENIPVIEIRGEGAPMSSAQIRHLEEMDNGGPLDIKIEKTFVPAKCPQQAKRLDFVTFHYKVFTEDNKKVYQTYGTGPVTIQLGTGMIMPGLDKGLKGMCAEELRKVRVPYRMSRKSKSKVWKNIPNDENWLIFNIEMVEIKPYTPEIQFKFLDLNEDEQLTNKEVQDFQKKMKKEFGKTWKNEDIDNVTAAGYYIKYFDVNGDGIVTEVEWLKIMDRDEKLINDKKTKEKGRKRDPGIGWILDFDNDGIVSYKENDEAADRFDAGPTLLPMESKDEL
ncbi:peptidylprolyl isomerase [Caenorhabditis elegans]|uniref:peptidylprolyl isomerase n=1 Tax=Caenorhabditis elegans TaxID=6239 RepID=O61826_CAEEL|nr:peptidylprolyl isomerase [Caenorhabditis elegans]CCD62100.1 peptidylprolyl isomerase [Caenorhabditis elegans]|eukprot:NP_492792.1 Peptidylprolyl isomerase [Caenorhabditis elegans]